MIIYQLIIKSKYMSIYFQYIYNTKKFIIFNVYFIQCIQCNNNHQLKFNR